MVYSDEVLSFIDKRLYEESNNSKLAREVKERFNLPQDFDAVRNMIGRRRAKRKLPEIDITALKDAAEEAGIDVESIKHGWLKNDTASLFVTNPYYDDGTLTQDKIHSIFDAVIEKYIDYEPTSIILPDSPVAKALKVTKSDAHVGMQPNPNSKALFQYEYNAQIFGQSVDKIYQSILKEHRTHGTFDIIYLDDLGDQADGWSGKTTRGGHDLPQNMTNAEVFETCLDVNINLVKRIVSAGVAKKIVLRSVTRDNHSGDFSLIINIAIKRIINLMYSKEIVEVDILKRFIEHRYYGEHCFLMTHGKDDEFMKRGMPLILDDKTIRFINDYIDHYNIKAKYIHLDKGDLHQIGYQRTKKFDYRNYMSLAPPSSWVMHNFGDSYSGYSLQIVPLETNEIQHTDYFIEYSKINT